MDLVRVERGQLVLVAAAVIAIALIGILFAYLQLGYHPDVDRSSEPTGEEAVSFLDRSVHSAAAETAGEYGWNERAALVAAVRSEIDDDIATLETARIKEGVGYRIQYARETATEWDGDVCRSEPGKRFGDCKPENGIIVQERAGEAVLVAVAFDVNVIGAETRTDLKIVVTVGS